jgi:sugar phosphate isomerase/epimerase
MGTTRRDLLRGATAAAAALGLGSSAGSAQSVRSLGYGGQEGDLIQPLFKISLAEWSLHRALKAGEMTNLDFPVRARREFEIEAVEYVNTFFKDEARDEAYLAELDKRCVEHGVDSLLIMCDGEGNLSHADKAERDKAVENHMKWIDAAVRLHCHSIRVNVGSEGEPEEVAKRSAEALVQLAEYAKPHDVCVIAENHGGISSDGAWLASVMKLAGHTHVGSLPDFGNFQIEPERWYDCYQGVRELMPYAKAVSAKSHDFDADGECAETDYRRMLQIVVESGYRGFVGIEYEGKGLSEPDGIRATKKLLERVRSGLG